jgi:hypothetical protein
MELKWVICGEAHIHSTREKTWERVSMVKQKKGIVAKRRERYAYLSKVVQVLQHGHFAQVDAVINVMSN